MGTGIPNKDIKSDDSLHDDVFLVNPKSFH